MPAPLNAIMTLIALSISAMAQRSFTVVNNCNYTIWYVFHSEKKSIIEETDLTYPLGPR